MGDKEERVEQDEGQGQVLSQVYKEERAQEQSLGPRHGHLQRSMGGEGALFLLSHFLLYSY